MQLHEKIRSTREDMKFSQGYVAHELGLDQSQYSRREKGEIPFVPNEIVKISKLLKISISDLFGEDVQMNQKDVNFKQNVSIVEKLMELYEIRIKEKEEMIALLKSQLNHNNK